jgi:ER-bound oxygenase mpaB/B'/Rubber oxygenase, catalytic domain
MLFTNEILNQKRLQTDPAADTVVEQIFTSGQAAAINSVMKQVWRNDQPLPETLPAGMQTFFEETARIPAWADTKLMEQGRLFFAKNAQALLTVLGYYSLPYCYAAADGAEVLFLSEKIRHNTTQRLTETGQFVLEVMSENAFAPEGLGIRSCQKVRLMHAAVRYHVLKSDNWNMTWGKPVNQEDMAGTNGAFSFISLRGLDKLGIPYTLAEAGAFLHLWKVIGFLMGVDVDLLPDTLKEAYTLDKKIAARHFRKSEAGTVLTQALIRSFEEFLPNPLLRPLIPAYLRFLLGKEVADLLDVPPSPSRVLDGLGFNALRAFNAVSGALPGAVSPNQVTHALFLQLQQQNQEITRFALPEKLR